MSPRRLVLGCLASVFLMLLATVVITTPIVVFGEGRIHDDDTIVNGVSSSINFCEEDFVSNAHIAEPSNTASSMASYIPLALLGLFGPPSKEWRSRGRGHRRFGVAYGTLLAIGVGSSLLHALLTAGAQGGDELPMLWFTACLGFTCSDEILTGFIGPTEANATPSTSTTLRVWLPWAYGLSSVMATCVYVFNRENFLPFWIMLNIYTYINLIGLIVLSFVVNWNGHPGFKRSVLLPLSVCTGWSAIPAVAAWTAEMLYCDDATKKGAFGSVVAPWFFNRGVHTCWHFGSAMLAWLLIQFHIAIKGEQQGWGTARLAWWGAPYVSFDKPKDS